MIQSTPLPRRSADEQARLEATLREVFEHKLCFNELLGFKVESLDPLEPKISFAMRKDLIGHFLHGRLHGGVIATVLDTVGGLAATVAIAEIRPQRTPFIHRSPEGGRRHMLPRPPWKGSIDRCGQPVCQAIPV